MIKKETCCPALLLLLLFLLLPSPLLSVQRDGRHARPPAQPTNPLGREPFSGAPAPPPASPLDKLQREPFSQAPSEGETRHQIRPYGPRSRYFDEEGRPKGVHRGPGLRQDEMKRRSDRTPEEPGEEIPGEEDGNHGVTPGKTRR